LYGCSYSDFKCYETVYAGLNYKFKRYIVKYVDNSHLPADEMRTLSVGAVGRTAKIVYSA